MRVVIMGCGRTGSLLAGMLDAGGHNATVIDWDPGALDRLPDNFSGQTIVGNALDQDVLRHAGVERAETFVATTSGDNRNIVAAEIAQHAFRVKRVVVRIKDPSRAQFFREKGMLVDCRTTAGTSVLLDMIAEQLSQQPA
ncbi:MAG: NAD-binding protein [Chloroflexota bacterium]